MIFWSFWPLFGGWVCARAWSKVLFWLFFLVFEAWFLENLPIFVVQAAICPQNWGTIDFESDFAFISQKLPYCWKPAILQNYTMFCPNINRCWPTSYLLYRPLISTSARYFRHSWPSWFVCSPDAVNYTVWSHIHIYSRALATIASQFWFQAFLLIRSSCFYLNDLYVCQLFSLLMVFKNK